MLKNFSLNQFPARLCSAAGAKRAISLAGAAFLLLFVLFLPALAETPAQTYQSTLIDLKKLEADPKKSLLRDAWEDLEKRFAALAEQKGDLGAKALYQRARTVEGLAGKSHAAGDHKKAAGLYAQMARRYPKHAWADDALLNQAQIQAKNLIDPKAAQQTLDALLKNYPKGDMVARAQALRKELGAQVAENAPGRLEDSKPAKAKPAPKKETPKEDPQAAQLAYDKAAAEWRGLRGDAKRSQQRDVWLALEERFAYIPQLAPSGPTAAKSAYQAAACREELAKRSFLEEDWKKAAELYEDAAKNYPKSSLADDCLYRRADILANRLDRPADAAGAARLILAEYPRGDMRPRAQALLKTLPTAMAAPARTANPPKNSIAKAPAKLDNIVEQLGLTVRTIMLDPGHGGKDPGAMGNNIIERERTLTLAKTLGRILVKRGYRVLYTRENNSYVALDSRTALANSTKADLFISLHVNANTNPQVNGLEIYYLDLARSDSAAVVAARENSVSVKSISDLQFILSDLMRSSKLHESATLADLVQKDMLARVRKAGFESRDNGVKSAPFYVLLGAKMPAVLVEIGYLSNTAEAKRINSAAYLERLAEGIANGVDAYKLKLSNYSASAVRTGQ